MKCIHQNEIVQFVGDSNDVFKEQLKSSIKNQLVSSIVFNLKFSAFKSPAFHIPFVRNNPI